MYETLPVATVLLWIELYKAIALLLSESHRVSMSALQYLFRIVDSHKLVYMKIHKLVYLPIHRLVLM